MAPGMGQLSPLEWIWHELNTVWIDKISMVRAPEGEQFAQVGDDLKSETGTLHEDGSFRWESGNAASAKITTCILEGANPATDGGSPSLCVKALAFAVFQFARAGLSRSLFSVLSLLIP